MPTMLMAVGRIKSAFGRPVATIERLGRHLVFYGETYARIPRTVRRYPKEVLRLVAEVSLGSGGLAMIGGTVAVVAVMTAAVGVEVGLQGYTSLANVGVQALAGFVSSYANTREAAPILCGIALSATVGAGFTAQLGAMRVAEEIDALEVMAVPSVPYLVTTRILAGAVSVVPLYCLALLGSFLASRLVVTLAYGQSAGTYKHYFAVFLLPSDLLWSFVKALTMAVFVMTVHCFFGYHAHGGPAGVGRAVGWAVRASLIGVLVVDVFLNLVIYSGPSTVHITG